MSTSILPVKNETDASINRITKDGRELTYGKINPLPVTRLTVPTDMAQKSKSSNSRRGPEHVGRGPNVRTVDFSFTLDHC